MKLSLESFKEKFNEESKEELLNELTGGVLGSCHCSSTGSGKSIEEQLDDMWGDLIKTEI